MGRHVGARNRGANGDAVQICDLSREGLSAMSLYVVKASFDAEADSFEALCRKIEVVASAIAREPNNEATQTEAAPTPSLDGFVADAR
jgi:hypothetical protein